MFITRGLDEFLQMRESHAVIQPVLDKSGRDQSGGVVTGDQKHARGGGFVDQRAKMGKFFRAAWRSIGHQRTHINTVGGGFAVARFATGEREDHVVINPRHQVDIAGELPNLGQRVGIIDITVSALDHHRHGQRIAKPRMVLIDLHVGIVGGQ